MNKSAKKIGKHPPHRRFTVDFNFSSLDVSKKLKQVVFCDLGGHRHQIILARLFSFWQNDEVARFGIPVSQMIDSSEGHLTGSKTEGSFINWVIPVQCDFTNSFNSCRLGVI